MAVTLTSHPDNNVAHAVKNCLPFTLQIDDIGDPLHPNKILYRILCDGNVVSTEECIIPKVSLTQTIDLSKEVRNFVSCGIPNPNSTAVSMDDLMKKSIQLEFGQATYDPDNCEYITEYTGQSPDITIVNSGFQADQENPFASVITMLTCRPFGRVLCKDAIDYLYVCLFGAGGNVTINQFSDRLGQIGTTNVSLSVGVNVIPFGPANMNLSGQTDYYQVDIDGQMFSTRVVDNCCDCDVQITFKEPLGGFTSMCFQLIEDRVSSSFTEVCKANACTNDLSTRLTQGMRMSGDRSFERLVLRKTVEACSERQKKWLKMFMLPTERYLVVNINGQKYHRSILSQTGEFTVNRKNDLTTLDLTVYYGQDYIF